MKKLILFLFIITVFASCKKSEDDKVTPIIDPVVVIPQSTAKFDSETELFLNQDLLLKNNSENAETYLWDFGDGTNSTQKEPIKQYAASGDYVVKLTTNGNSTISKSVKVYNKSHSVAIKNNTQNTFQITLFDRIDDNTVGAEKFTIASLAPGQTSVSFFTDKTKIAYGGKINGFNFVCLSPRFYVMETGNKNLININADSQLTLGLTPP